MMSGIQYAVCSPSTGFGNTWEILGMQQYYPVWTWSSIIQGVVVAELPPDFQSWQRRSEWMLRNFCAASKTSLTGLQDVLKFLNGDTTSHTVFHWCVSSGTQECCRSESESIGKLIKLVLPWFGRAFDVPLLSRFKHYGPASSYMKIGCALHGLLPRALENLRDNTSIVNSDIASMIDTLLADTSVPANTFSEDDMEADQFSCQLFYSRLFWIPVRCVLQRTLCDNWMIIIQTFLHVTSSCYGWGCQGYEFPLGIPGWPTGRWHCLQSPKHSPEKHVV